VTAIATAVLVCLAVGLLTVELPAHREDAAARRAFERERIATLEAALTRRWSEFENAAHRAGLNAAELREIRVTGYRARQHVDPRTARPPRSPTAVTRASDRNADGGNRGTRAGGKIGCGCRR
jgi:hypothetical protein